MVLEQRVNALMARHAQLADEIATLQRVRDIVDKTLASVQHKASEALNAVGWLSRKLQGLQADNRTFQGQLASLARKVDAQERTIRALQQRLTFLEASRQNVEL